MLHDAHHRVRADAIRTLVFAISSVKNINQENADLFSEYLFPNLVKKNFCFLFIMVFMIYLVNIGDSR